MNTDTASPPDQSGTSHGPVYRRVLALSQSRWLLPILLLIEIIETAILPLPYEAIFVALSLLARKRIWQFVAITVLGSAIAGTLVYAVGAYAAEPVAAALGAEAQLAEYGARFRENGGSFILLGGISPAPSHPINMAAGASGYPYWSFLGYYTLSRFIRFAILGGLIYIFGDRLVEVWKRLPGWLKHALTWTIIVGVGYWFVSGLM